MSSKRHAANTQHRVEFKASNGQDLTDLLKTHGVEREETAERGTLTMQWHERVGSKNGHRSLASRWVRRAKQS